MSSQACSDTEQPYPHAIFSVPVCCWANLKSHLWEEAGSPLRAWRSLPLPFSWNRLSPSWKKLLPARLVQLTQSLVTDSPCYSSPNKQCDNGKDLLHCSLCLNVYFNSRLKASTGSQRRNICQHGFGANHWLLVSWCRRALNGHKSIHLQVFLLS